MKYSIKNFNSAVDYYQKKLSKYKNKTVFIHVPINNKKAYYSTAPLSRAIHNLNAKVNIAVAPEDAKSIAALKEVWGTFDDLKKGVKNQKTTALDEFIGVVDKKAKGKFRKIFEKPDLILFSNHNKFCSKELRLELKDGWFKEYRWNDLIKTAKIIWAQVYNLKKHEKVGFGFETMPIQKKLELPLEDYLDSYAINRAMMDAIPNEKSAGAETAVWSQLAEGERIGELKATLFGCELEKDINEPIFKKYKILSRLLRLNRLKPNDATFGVHGKGYGGKHLFGELIGYPTPNGKSRWSSPGGIVYKFNWHPQSKYESRNPRTRVGFTETLPIDIFIKTCKIDWLKMKRKNDKLIRLFDKSRRIIIDSNKKNGTNFEVGLIKPNGEHRMTNNSDVDIRSKIDKRYYKQTGLKTGTMANIPGGEAFVTPEYLIGRVVGDVVISIDQSYRLSEKSPFIINVDKKGYKVEKAPPKIKKEFDKEKREAWKQLLIMEKHKSLPQEIINLKKRNFNRIGEFAVNTNPTAELCDYLIVNEKIAGMIHVAMGSGFDNDRSTVYHTDVVINAKRQKLDIYGVNGSNKFWIMKKGKLLV